MKKTKQGVRDLNDLKSKSDGKKPSQIAYKMVVGRSCSNHQWKRVRVEDYDEYGPHCYFIEECSVCGEER